MGRRSDDAVATLLLTHRLSDRTDEPLKSNEYWQLLADVGENPGRLLGQTPAAIEDTLGCAPAQAVRLASLLDEGNRMAFSLEEVEHSGLTVITVFDDGFPLRLRDRLGRLAPPLLHVAGSLDLLHDDGVAVVGSRAASPAARQVASAVARLAAEHGLVTVSGGARGIDQTAMAAAREAGGRVVGALADSLTRRLAESETRRAVLDGEVTLLTPYHPSAAFSVGSAMGRNKIIYGLARMTVVVTSDKGDGGTWGGATEAIKRRFGTVAVWTGDGAGAGNQPLVERGALAFDCIDERLLTTAVAEYQAPAPPEQLSLPA
ncbi:MAG: DNA-protecting protein DprA [Candidatus Dormibacteraeota bacterium]|uniref:DNA-protecting protein DprA n=1 Tax=Candidatus Amunia macphersoniae TaxID=3127014 RepID=A0A934KAY9_9BACT|nr:DNA-protecting protein DprA [Candidatus Dormibacteraeota bacterium]